MHNTSQRIHIPFTMRVTLNDTMVDLVTLTICNKNANLDFVGLARSMHVFEVWGGAEALLPDLAGFQNRLLRVCQPLMYFPHMS